MADKKLSQDEMIKNLVRDYPEDALLFIKPEIIEKYGKPVKISFDIQEIKKHSHFDPNLKNDIPVIYEFANGKKVVLALIEHWSEKYLFDIHRFAHYFIDLDYRYPDYEKLPVALFTDKSKQWKKQPQKEIVIKCLDEVYMKFSYKLVRLKDHKAEKYKDTKNKFIAVLRSAMNWDQSEKILFAVQSIQVYNITEPDVKRKIRNLEIIDYFLDVSEQEKDKIVEILENKKEISMITEALMEKGIEKGMEKGEIKGKLKTAKKLFEEGMSLEFVIKVTGLTKEELEGHESSPLKSPLRGI